MEFQKYIRLLIDAEDKTGPGLDSARARLDGLKAAAARLNNVLGPLGAGLALAGVAATVKSLKDIADELDRAAKSAQKVGVSVENLTALEYAAGQAGVEVGELESSMVKLNRSTVEADQGSREQAEAFAALGIQARDVNGHLKTADQLLLEIAEAFAAFPDGPQKSALAMQLFGRSGANLIPLLNQGRAGITGMMEEARRLGVVMDSETAAAAEKFNDNLDRLSKAMTGLKRQAGENVIPALADITDAMTQAAKEGRGLMALWVGLGGLGALAFTDEFAAASVKAAKLGEELNRLEMLRDGLARNATGIGLVDRWFWGDAQDLDRRIADTRRQIEDLLKPPTPQEQPRPQDSQVSQLIEAKKDELADLRTVTQAQERVLSESNRELSKVLSDRETAVREFRKLFADITAEQRDADEKLTGLDLSQALAGADTARATGDLDAALEKARAAAELIRQAKAQGEGFSTLELQFYARRAAEIADAIMAERQSRAESAQAAARQGLDQLLEKAKGLEAIPLRVNTEYADGVVKSFHASMQEYLNRNPLTVKVLADTSNAGRGGADEESLRRMISEASLARGARQ